MENGTFWSEIGSGFGDAGGTPPPKISRSILRAGLINSKIRKEKTEKGSL